MLLEEAEELKDLNQERTLNRNNDELDRYTSTAPDSESAQSKSDSRLVDAISKQIFLPYGGNPGAELTEEDQKLYYRYKSLVKWPGGHIESDENREELKKLLEKLKRRNRQNPVASGGRPAVLGSHSPAPGSRMNRLQSHLGRSVEPDESPVGWLSCLKRWKNSIVSVLGIGSVLGWYFWPRKVTSSGMITPAEDTLTALTQLVKEHPILASMLGCGVLYWLHKRLCPKPTNVVTRATAKLVGQSETDLKSNGLSAAGIFLIVLVLLALGGLVYSLWGRQGVPERFHDIEEGFGVMAQPQIEIKGIRRKSSHGLYRWKRSRSCRSRQSRSGRRSTCYSRSGRRSTCHSRSSRRSY